MSLRENFGPTEADYEAVIRYAQSHGLTVTGRHSNRVVVGVQGAVADIERAFHVTFERATSIPRKRARSLRRMPHRRWIWTCRC